MTLAHKENRDIIGKFSV